MKYLLKKRAMLFLIGFSQYFHLFFIDYSFARQIEIPPDPIEVSNSEVQLYKGLISGDIVGINKDTGVITVFHENNGKLFNIEIPIETIPKHYLIKKGHRVLSLLTKDSSGYENIHIITDPMQIKRALSYGLYNSVPENPEEAANLAIYEEMEESIKPIAIKDKK